jgi:hypothetical protein
VRDVGARTREGTAASPSAYYAASAIYHPYLPFRSLRRTCPSGQRMVARPWRKPLLQDPS